MSLRHIALSSLRSAERLLRGRVPADALGSVDEFLILFYDQALGTAIHATPVFEALRHARPKARITVASCGMELETIRNSPFIDRIIATPNPYKHTLAAARAIRRAFHPGKLFCTITTGGSGRSRIALLALAAGKSIRVGFTLTPELYDAPLSPTCNDSQIERNLRALRLLGMEAQDLQPSIFEPRIFFTADDLRHAQSFLTGEAKGTAILVACTSGGHPKNWPEDRLIAAAQHLTRACGLRLLLPGTKADVAPLTLLAERIGHGAHVVAGKTNISQLAALCAISDIALTLDTGTLHVARTQMLPMIILAPAWQPPEEWLPLGRPWARIHVGPAIPLPPPADYVIDEIAAADVISSIDGLLATFPPSAADREARIHRSLTEAKAR
jgi:ADP-heptose:LPS heptosyltransferase